MQISNKAIALIKEFEGRELTAYQDVVGVWTIGYGWTGTVDGRKISRGMTITQTKADELLREGVKEYESGVKGMLRVQVDQCQFDALVSFAYNLGVSALRGSTLMRKLNAGDARGAADEFLRWNKAGGEVLAGLTRRRRAERELFLCSA